VILTLIIQGTEADFGMVPPLVTLHGCTYQNPSTDSNIVAPDSRLLWDWYVSYVFTLNNQVAYVDLASAIIPQGDQLGNYYISIV
jgi:hypothetical protein